MNWTKVEQISVQFSKFEFNLFIESYHNAFDIKSNKICKMELFDEPNVSQRALQTNLLGWVKLPVITVKLFALLANRRGTATENASRLFEMTDI